MLSGNSATLGNDNGGSIVSMIGDIVMFKIVSSLPLHAWGVHNEKKSMINRNYIPVGGVKCIIYCLAYIYTCIYI